MVGDLNTVRSQIACGLTADPAKTLAAVKRGKQTLESIHKLDRREARPMPKFVKLLIDDEATMLVNLETVTKIKDGDEEGLTAIYFIGSEHPLRVKDSGQDILRKAKAEW